MTLAPVDKAEILVLVDNYVDLLIPATDRARRPALAQDGMIRSDTLIAEHGLSLLVTLSVNGATHRVLLDTGYNALTLRHNALLLGQDLSGIETIVISHGHMDHTGGLDALLEQIIEPPTVCLHPTAFAKRWLEPSPGDRAQFPVTLTPETLTRRGAQMIETRDPVSVCDDTVMVTGRIPRTVEFETGFPGALIESEGSVTQDSIEDDQSVVLNLKDKGLIVISGCAHSGIINSVRYASEISGVDRVHAVIGGFHLTGAVMEPRIEPTIEEMKRIAPETVVPMHCTGAQAIRRFSEELPDAFEISSVGTTFTFSS